MSILKEHSTSTYWRDRVYINLSDNFRTSSLRQDCPNSPLSRNFVSADVLVQALHGLTEMGIESFSSCKLTDLDYADYILLLLVGIDISKYLLDSFSGTMHTFRMQFASIKGKVLFQGFVGSSTLKSDGCRQIHVPMKLHHK